MRESDSTNLYHDYRWGRIAECCFGHRYRVLVSESPDGVIDGLFLRALRQPGVRQFHRFHAVLQLRGLWRRRTTRRGAPWSKKRSAWRRTSRRGTSSSARNAPSATGSTRRPTRCRCASAFPLRPKNCGNHSFEAEEPGQGAAEGGAGMPDGAPSMNSTPSTRCFPAT